MRSPNDLQNEVKNVKFQDQQSNLLRKLKLQLNELVCEFQIKKQQKSKLSKKLRQVLQKKQFYLKEKNVQQKKYKSLNLLVNELQSNFEKQNLQMKSKQFFSNDEQGKGNNLQYHFLRQQLVKINEKCKQDQKLYTFLKQMNLNKTNIKNFVGKSNFIENQAEQLAKLRAELNVFQNSNFECRRKWFALQRQKRKNESDLKIFQIQLQRQSQLLKSLYEEYLEKINSSKAKIVSFNQTNKEKYLTQFLVQEVSLIQQKRRQIEDENRSLHLHLEELSQQFERIDLQNRQLNSFFLNETRTQESKLAMKMKARIEQLRDILIETENKNSISSTINKKSSNLEYVRNKLTKAKQFNDLLQIRLKDIDRGIFNSLDQKEISEYFSKILNSKQDKIQMSRQRNQSMKMELKQLSMKELLLQNQISNIQESLRENDIESQYMREEQIKRINKK